MSRIPGTLWNRSGRWWWRGTLPGSDKREAIPLVPVGQSLATKDEMQARAILEQLWQAAEIKAGREDHWDGLVGSLVARYRDFAKGYYVHPDKTPTTSYANIVRATERLLTQAADLPVNEFGPKALADVRESWIADRLCRSTINQWVGLIQSMFVWGVSQEFVPVMVADSLKSMMPLHKGRSEAVEPREVPPVPTELVEATLPYMTPTLRAMVDVQRLTGMRGIEVWNMKPRHIERGPAGVESVWFYNVPPEANKTEHHNDHPGEVRYCRRVPLVGQAQEILAPFMLRSDDDYLFTPEQSEQERNAARRANRETPLWSGHVARYDREAASRTPRTFQPTWNKDSYRRAIHSAVSRANSAIRAELHKAMPKATPKEFKDAFEKVKLPSWNPHQIRHLVATVAADRGEMARDGARALLGHKTADMTDYYRRIEDAKAVDAARFVADRFAKKTGTTDHVEG